MKMSHSLSDLCHYTKQLKLKTDKTRLMSIINRLQLSFDYHVNIEVDLK